MNHYWSHDNADLIVDNIFKKSKVKVRRHTKHSQSSENKTNKISHGFATVKQLLSKRVIYPKPFMNLVQGHVETIERRTIKKSKRKLKI